MSVKKTKSNDNKNFNSKSSPRLKSWMGIQPIVYAPVIIISLVFAVIFFVFTYPGIRYYGTRLNIESWPEGAAVYINDKMLGSTPLELFVPAGHYTLRLEKPHFETTEFPVLVKGRLFFSLFFPKKQDLNLSIKIKDLPGFLADSYYQASSWFSMPADRIHMRPPVLEEAARALRDSWDTTQVHVELVNQWVLSLKDLVQDEESWRQVDMAWRMLSEDDIILPARLSPLRKANSFKEFLEASQQVVADSLPQPQGVVSSGNMRLAGLNFTIAPGGRLNMGNPGEGNEFLPTTVQVSPFYYTSTYLSIEDYVRLSGQSVNQDTTGVVTGLTMAEVHPVLDSINKTLQSQGRDELIARLPSEAEWQYLAETRRIQPEFFEWTGDNYLPYRFILYPGQASFPQPFETREKVVRGQSIFSGAMPNWYRFGFPQDYLSPYITFRVVLAKKP